MVTMHDPSSVLLKKERKKREIELKTDGVRKRKGRCHKEKEQIKISIIQRKSHPFF